MITIRNSNLFCTNCGDTFKLAYPLAVDSLTSKTEAFSELHKDCKQTWVEPKADLSKSVKERVSWWWQNSERGSSSEAMWYHLAGAKSHPNKNHPHDPDDFKRCYNLLEVIPEWKKDLDKLRELSPQWSKLVDKWIILTELYEVQLETKEDKGMFDLMQEILNME